MHGPALEQEALQTAVQDSVQQLLTENKLRPAMQPSVNLAQGYEPGKDAEVTVELEVLPEIPAPQIERSEEHTSELQSLMRISYAVFCLKKKNKKTKQRCKIT